MRVLQFPPVSQLPVHHRSRCTRDQPARTLRYRLRPVSVGVSGLSPRVGLPAQVDTWPGDQLAHELIAGIQAHLLTSTDDPSFAAPVAFTPQLDVSMFCLHTAGEREYTQKSCGRICELLWKCCGM
jgi:hypothetical protein